MSEEKACRLHLHVVTPRRLLVDAEVDEARIPGLDGQIGILPGHRPLMLALGKGPVIFRQGTVEETIEVEGGTAEIVSDRVLVFTALPE
jgi:F-type H+-transporting ATPase subunit epsilon